MGIIGTWRKLKVLQAATQAANESAAQGSAGQSPQQQGMIAGLANVVADVLAPRAAALAERRGGPLPGSDGGVIDGSAWTKPITEQKAQLQARDAAFDADLLVAFAEQVFSAVVAVWAGADAGTVRPVMSDALWEPLAAATGTGLRTDVWTRLGQQRPTARLVGLSAGTWYDSAQVAIGVKLIGDQVPSDMPPGMREWDEDWLFQRSAQPGGDPMIRPTACPTCGAPTRVDDQGTCLHCREAVPFLTTGWLVTQIVSHHPSHALRRERLAQVMQENPEAFARLSPQMRRTLYPDLPEVTGSGPPPDPAP